MEPAGSDVLDTWPVGMFGLSVRAQGRATRPLRTAARACRHENQAACGGSLCSRAFSLLLLSSLLGNEKGGLLEKGLRSTKRSSLRGRTKVAKVGPPGRGSNLLKSRRPLTSTGLVLPPGGAIVTCLDYVVTRTHSLSVCLRLYSPGSRVFLALIQPNNTRDWSP